MALFSLPPLFPPTPPREEATPEEIRIWHYRLTSFLGALPRLLEESMEAFNDFPNMRNNSITLQAIGSASPNDTLTGTESSAEVSVVASFDTGQVQLTATVGFYGGEATGGQGTFRIRRDNSAGTVVTTYNSAISFTTKLTQNAVFSALDTPPNTAQTYVVTGSMSGTATAQMNTVELKAESFKK